jgi:hypothetical protein
LADVGGPCPKGGLGSFVEGVFEERIELDEKQVFDVANFLRVLNSGFNLALARQRNEATRRVDQRYGEGQRALANRLLELADAELLDALRVLSQAGLHPLVRSQVRSAVAAHRLARDARSPLARALLTGMARGLIRLAAEGLGSGLHFELGEGNLLF